jgi:hypothetical protein
VPQGYEAFISRPRADDPSRWGGTLSDARRPSDTSLKGNVEEGWRNGPGSRHPGPSSLPSRARFFFFFIVFFLFFSNPSDLDKRAPARPNYVIMAPGLESRLRQLHHYYRSIAPALS